MRVFGYSQGADDDSQGQGDNPGDYADADGQPQAFYQPHAVGVPPEHAPIEIIGQAHVLLPFLKLRR
jgi:hypothetical protein